MWIRRDYQPAFDRLRWGTFDQVMTAAQPVLTRRVAHRANLVADVPSPAGEGSTRIYIKRHYGERCRRSPFGHSPLVAGVTSGVHEADAVGACQRAGVPTMDVVAAGQRTGPGGRLADSFFISEQLAGARPADDYWRQQLQAPSPRADSPAHDDDLHAPRARLLDAMADVTARLHGAGLYHRDLYWCHFMVTPSTPSAAVTPPPATQPAMAEQVHLIDLQRLCRPRWSAYARIKDLAQFMVSAPTPPAGPAPIEMERWFARYLSEPRVGRHHRLFYAAVRTRARLYRLKGIHG